MANMLALNAVYNHYLTTYARTGMSKYDTHKKSELRNIYNSIVKLNKESPIYLAINNQEAQAYAIGVKEGARELHNIIASLGGQDECQILSKKVAYSSNESMISAQYIGDDDVDGEVPSYDVEVKSLATPQVNMGNFLDSDTLRLPKGSYSLAVRVQNRNYEFAYDVQDGDTNLSIQEKLARIISKADIGINASVVRNGDSSALRLESEATGAPAGKGELFDIYGALSSSGRDSVEYLGIGDVTRFPTNAELIINGMVHSISSNHFTLEKTYELNLKGISPVEGQTARISVKNDVESAKENIGKLIDGYNDFIDLAKENNGGYDRNGNNLLREMREITSIHKNSLGNMGLTFTEDGKLSLNSDIFAESIEPEDVQQTVSSVRDFAESLVRKTNQISLDPMHYVKRVMVAYKNPGKNFAPPYISSPYSGMMFNGYC